MTYKLEAALHGSARYYTLGIMVKPIGLKLLNLRHIIAARSLFIISLAVIGVVSVLSGYAATNTIKLESETGMLTGNAAKLTDATASSGATVRFGNAAATGPALYVAKTGKDSNPGTQAAPFATIEKAVTAVTPGTTVHVAPGMYTGTSNISSGISGTANARITYISDTKWGAKLSYNADTVWYNHSDYIDIIGFDMTGSGPDGIYNYGSHTRIIGNLVHDIPANPCNADGGGGIIDGNYTASDNDIVGNIVHDIGPYSPICEWVQGIYQSDSGGHISNNIVYRVSGWGIHLWHKATNATVTNNLVFNNGDGGIVIGAEVAEGGKNDNTLVSNNIVMDTRNANYAIDEEGVTGVNNKIINNILYGNSNNAIRMQNSLHDKGTIFANPQLVNYKADGSGDYHLQAGSPAINAGAAQSAPATDYDHVARPQGSAFDIGPFEYLNP